MDRPIIFNTEMVKAILEGRKIQTRRVIKPQPYPPNGITIECHDLGDENGYGFFDEERYYKCPYGKVGDRLWVRETWIEVKKDITYVGKIIIPKGIYYKADNYLESPKWKPSIHMPRNYSRITLEITDIRVEKLRNMTSEDAIAEGMTPELAVKLLTGKDYLPYCIMVGGMKMLWNSIHKKEHRWEDNPWVWVIEFKKLTHRR